MGAGGGASKPVHASRAFTRPSPASLAESGFCIVERGDVGRRMPSAPPVVVSSSAPSPLRASAPAAFAPPGVARALLAPTGGQGGAALARRSSYTVAAIEQSALADPLMSDAPGVFALSSPAAGNPRRTGMPPPGSRMSAESRSHQGSAVSAVSSSFVSGLARAVIASPLPVARGSAAGASSTGRPLSVGAQALARRRIRGSDAAVQLGEAAMDDPDDDGVPSITAPWGTASPAAGKRAHSEAPIPDFAPSAHRPFSAAHNPIAGAAGPVAPARRSSKSPGLAGTQRRSSKSPASAHGSYRQSDLNSYFGGASAVRAAQPPPAPPVAPLSLLVCGGLYDGRVFASVECGAVVRDGDRNIGNQCLYLAVWGALTGAQQLECAERGIASGADLRVRARAVFLDRESPGYAACVSFLDHVDGGILGVGEQAVQSPEEYHTLTANGDILGGPLDVIATAAALGWPVHTFAHAVFKMRTGVQVNSGIAPGFTSDLVIPATRQGPAALVFLDSLINHYTALPDPEMAGGDAPAAAVSGECRGPKLLLRVFPAAALVSVPHLCTVSCRLQPEAEVQDLLQQQRRRP